MKKSKLIKILLIISVLCLNIYGAWTDGGGSGQRVFTKPINFWNAIVTTSTTQQTSMNAVFPFSREIQAMNAIFETDSENKSAVRIRLDEASLTNLANFATTNIAIQLSLIMDNLYATGIWSVATATNSSKVYVDTLVSSETASRIAGDISGSNNVSGLISTEESARIAADALKYDKAGGSIGGDVIVGGNVRVGGDITSINVTGNSVIVKPTEIQLENKYGDTIELAIPDNATTYLAVSDKIRCSAPSDDTEVALLSTVKTFTNAAFNTAKAYTDSQDTGGTNALTESRYLKKSGGTMTGNLDMNGHNISTIGDINYIDYIEVLGTIGEIYNISTIGSIGSIVTINSLGTIDTLNKINSNVSMENHVISNLANGVSAFDAVNKSQLDTKLNLSGGTMSGNLSVTGAVIATSKIEYGTAIGFKIILEDGSTGGKITFGHPVYSEVTYEQTGDNELTFNNVKLKGIANGVSANDAVNKGYVDAATNAVQTVQEPTVTNISDYVSLNNISNYIYMVECTSATSGSTNSLLSSYITIKDLNGNFITEQVCLDIVLDNTDYDTFSTYEGEVINLSTLKHYKHIITDGACTIALWRNKSGSTQIKMYVTYGQSTDQTTFNFSN